MLLIHAAGVHVFAELLRQKVFVDQNTFQTNQNSLIAAAADRFDFMFLTSLNASNKLPSDDYPNDDIRQFMDYCAPVHWERSKIKSNPLVAIKRIIDLVPVLRLCVGGVVFLSCAPCMRATDVHLS